MNARFCIDGFYLGVDPMTSSRHLAHAFIVSVLGMCWVGSGINTGINSGIARAQADLNLDTNSGVPAAKLVRQSVSKVLYPDRSPKIVAEINLYSDDSRKYNGRYIEYYPNGREFVRGQYLNGRRHGAWVLLRMNGSEAKRGNYVGDRPDGSWVILRHNGTKLREESYKEGIPHGTWSYFSPDGTISVREIRFDNGKRVDN